MARGATCRCDAYPFPHRHNAGRCGGHRMSNPGGGKWLKYALIAGVAYVGYTLLAAPKPQGPQAVGSTLTTMGALTYGLPGGPGR